MKTNEELFNECLEAASRIVEAEKELWPGCEGVRCDFSTSVESGSTAFKRKGTSTSDSFYGLPAALSSLVNTNAGVAKPNSTTSEQQNTFLYDLLSKGTETTTLPGVSTLNTHMGISPTAFTGQSELASIISRNPFSSKYEDDTADAYKQMASDALAQVASGPDAVRGGVARTGIAQGVMSERLAQGRGQEVRNAQLQDAALVQSAANIYNQLENARRGVSLQAQQQLGGQTLGRQGVGTQAAGLFQDAKTQNMAMLKLAADLLGTRTGKTADDLSGEGNQSMSHMGGGFSLCCFIFLEALNGKLPWFIELARRDYYTEQRRRGYKWMSRFLVPAMQRSRAWRWLVNTTIVSPFLRYGAWLYGAEGGRGGWLLAPYCHGWLTLWDFIGLFVELDAQTS